jgi:hypothetical protein
MSTGLLAALCGSLLAVLPALRSDRSSSSRPLPGDEPSVLHLKLDPSGLDAARDRFKGRDRIAVLPFTVVKGDPSQWLAALGCAEAMTADLHYAPGLLVLDRSEVLRARREPAAPGEIGRALGVRYLVSGTVRREAADDVLEVEALEIGPDTPGEPGAPASALNHARALAHASARQPAGHIYELADDALLKLLEQLKAVPPPERLVEITRVPTLSDSARALCDDGFALMDRCAGVYRGDDVLLCQRALKDSEAALKADPRYVRAAVLQASCLLRQGDTQRLDHCLSEAFNLRTPENRIDALTRMEIDGDYAAFVQRDFATAVTHYEKILEIDPGHLHALWMLTAIHAGEFPPYRWPGYSLEKAGDYAARLIVAHPGTAAARLLSAKTR